MSKHSPGPWAISTEQIVYWEILAADGSRVLGFYDSDGEVPNEENARLLIAAPEMLELLRRIQRDRYDPLWRIADDTEALLKKIDGET